MDQIVYLFPTCAVNEAFLRSKNTPLSPKELEYYYSLNYVLRQKEWASGRIAVKHSVQSLDRYKNSSLANISIEYTHNRAPCIIPRCGIDISIAHNSHLAVATSAMNAQIGIDIESIHRVVSESQCEYFLTQQEQVSLSDCGSFAPHRLIYWTLKEATLKATKTGLTVSPKIVRIESIDMSKKSAVITVNDTAWYGAWKQYGEQIMSVVLSKPIESIVIVPIISYDPSTYSGIDLQTSQKKAVN